MPIPKGKEKFSLWVRPETLKRVDELYQKDGQRTRSEFIEKAIDFYCGNITAEKYDEYFPEMVVATVKGALNSLETRMAKLLFKMAVEQAMMTHVVAATNDVQEESLSRLRAMCVLECKKVNGALSFADAVKFQGED